MVCNGEPDPAMVGCYYGVLNVVDPSIAYDSNGKIVGTLRLPSSSHTTPAEHQNEFAERNPSEILEDDDDYRNDGAVLSEAYENEENHRTESDAPPMNYDDNEDHEVDEEVNDSGLIQNPPKQGYYEAWVQSYLSSKSSNDILKLASSDQEEKGVLERVETFPDEDYVETELQEDHSFSKKADAAHFPEAKPAYHPELDPADYPQEEAEVTVVSVDASPVSVSDTKPKAVDEASDLADPKLAVEPSWSSSWFPWTQTKSEAEASIDSKVASFSEKAAEPKVAPDSSLSGSLPREDPGRKEPAPVNETELEESYGESTPLYKTLERRNWHAVLFFLRTGSFSFNPLLGSTDMSVVKEHVCTWVTKKDITGKEMWRQLPLHAAICFGAPQKVVENLFGVYPDAAKKPDGHGNLPLHLAFIFRADDEITAFLMRSFPASIHVMNQDGLMPIQCSTEVSSETFQSKAELFDALSDYTRAVAENTPEKLVEQLQDVRRQLKAVNDTLFGDAPPRKPEAIKNHIDTMTRNSVGTPATRSAAASRSPAFDATVEFVDVIGLGLCSRMAASNKALTDGSEHIDKKAPAAANSAHSQHGATQQSPAIPRVACRVKEYCPKTKTWREV